MNTDEGDTFFEFGDEEEFRYNSEYQKEGQPGLVLDRFMSGLEQVPHYPIDERPDAPTAIENISASYQDSLYSLDDQQEFYAQPQIT